MTKLKGWGGHPRTTTRSCVGPAAGFAEALAHRGVGHRAVPAGGAAAGEPTGVLEDCCAEDGCEPRLRKMR